MKENTSTQILGSLSSVSLTPRASNRRSSRAISSSSFILLGMQLMACASPPPFVACPEPKITAATPAAPSATPTPSAAPTPEELAEEKARRRLADDYHRLAQATEAEIARLSPELRREALALSSKYYASGKAAIKAALASNHRRPGNAERDAARNALETLKFFGFEPHQTVIEYGPGAGWYTELLAPALARRGKLIATLSDPNGPPDIRGTYYGKRTQLFLQSLQEAYGKVELNITGGKSPKLSAKSDSVDMAFVVRGMHGMFNRKVLDLWLSEFHRTLKPGGILAVIQHRTSEGTDPIASSKNGYLPQKFVIEQVSKAGFKLEASSEINANAKDLSQHANGVWSLPPSLVGGDKDREKYLAIGESDRMTLKFIKVDKTSKDSNK